MAAAPRAPVPSLHHQLGQSISSSCDRTGGPLHPGGAWQTARRPVARSPRPGPCTCARTHIVRDRRSPPARSGRKARSAPSCRRPARRSSRRHRRAHVPPAGRTRARLHRRKRRHTVDAPMPRRLARKCHRGESGGQLVLASDASAWSLHSGKRRRQLTGASATIVHKAAARAWRRHRRSIDAGPLTHTRASTLWPPFPPPRPSPLDTPPLAPPFFKESPKGRGALATRAI